MHPTSLLVAALVMLRRPCARNQATASLLLARASQHAALSPAEREACLNLVDELECEAQPALMAQGTKTSHLAPGPQFGNVLAPELHPSRAQTPAAQSGQQADPRAAH